MSGGRRPSPAELSQITETAWTIANARFAAIEPLLDRNVSRPSVQEQACHVGVDVSTLYRWLKKFRKSHLVSDLLPDTRGVRHGDKRLAADAEGVVTEVIGKRYLNKQRWSAQKICDEVAAQCRERGIEAPHPNSQITLNFAGHIFRQRQNARFVKFRSANEEGTLAGIEVAYCEPEQFTTPDSSRVKKIGRAH